MQYFHQKNIRHLDVIKATDSQHCFKNMRWNNRNEYITNGEYFFCLSDEYISFYLVKANIQSVSPRDKNLKKAFCFKKFLIGHSIQEVEDDVFRITQCTNHLSVSFCHLPYPFSIHIDL